MIESALSKISSRNLKVLYWVLRSFTLLCGVFLAIGLIARFLMPGLYYDEGPVPSFRYQVLDGTKDAILVLLLLFPNRWTLTAPFFQLRLGLMVLFVFRVLFISLSGLAGYVRGIKHWAIIPTILMLLLFAGSMVVTLLMKRYFQQNNAA